MGSSTLTAAGLTFEIHRLDSQRVCVRLSGPNGHIITVTSQRPDSGSDAAVAEACVRMLQSVVTDEKEADATPNELTLRQTMGDPIAHAVVRILEVREQINPYDVITQLQLVDSPIPDHIE